MPQIAHSGRPGSIERSLTAKKLARGVGKRAGIVIGGAERSEPSRFVGSIEGELREASEEEGEVGFDEPEHFEELVDEGGVAARIFRGELSIVAEGGEAEFLSEHDALFGFVGVPVAFERGFDGGHVVDEREQRLREFVEVPARDERLVRVAIAAAVRVGGVGGEVGIEVIEHTEGAVVDGEPEYRHVVRIHYAVDEADAHPVHHELGGAARDFANELEIRFFAGFAERGIVEAQRVVGELFQERELAA